MLDIKKATIIQSLELNNILLLLIFIYVNQNVNQSISVINFEVNIIHINVRI